VVVGGMLATTWVQIIKATLLLLGVATMAIWVLARFGVDPIRLFNRAAANSGKGAAYSGLRPDVDVVVFACTSAGALRGNAYEEEPHRLSVITPIASA
jgi:Na+(H+)/acetate symporter ActP